jgi:tetratricopeptide (TPR) repeat protein
MKNFYPRPSTNRGVRALICVVLFLANLLSACQSKSTPVPPTPSPTPLPTLAPTATAAPRPSPTPTVLVVQSTPAGDPAEYLASGRAHMEAGELAKAIADLEAAVFLAPDLIEAQFYLGNAYTAVGRLADAEARFQAVLGIEPEHLSAHSNLGVVYLQMGRMEEAQVEFQAALALDESDAQVHYLLGVTHVRLGELDQANGRFEQARERFEQARERFEQAVALDSELPEPYFGLGTIYYLAEETEKAIEAFETFLAKGPAQDPAAEEEARRILAVLKAQ